MGGCQTTAHSIIWESVVVKFLFFLGPMYPDLLNQQGFGKGGIQELHLKGPFSNSERHVLKLGPQESNKSHHQPKNYTLSPPFSDPCRYLLSNHIPGMGRVLGAKGQARHMWCLPNPSFSACLCRMFLVLRNTHVHLY